MGRRTRQLLICACAVAGMTCPVAVAAEAGSTVAGLIAKMPAKTPAAEKALCAELVKLGPSGVTSICKRLVPPGTGDDTKARYALSALAAYVNRPGTGAQQRMVADALVQALNVVTDREVKAFLIRQLQVAGTEAQLRALAPLLTDPHLCEPATQAMLAVGGPDLPAMLAQALPKAAAPSRVTLLNALARCGAKGALGEIRKHVASSDVGTRLAALHALARAGDATDGGLLAKAAEAESPYERAKATAFYLLYVRRLDDKARAAAICRVLIKARSAKREANVRCAALQALVEILGDAALGDLLAAMDDACPQLQHAALRSAGKIPGQAATAKWVAKAKQAAPATRAEIVEMLGRRGDTSALPALVAALEDKEKVVRLAAIPAAGRLGGDAVLAGLLAVLRTGQADEVGAVKGTLLRMGGDRMLPAVVEALATMPPKARVAMLEVLAARHATAHLDAVWAQTKDENGAVRLAALEAIGRIAGEGELPRLVQLMLTAGGDEVAAAQQAVVAVALRGANVQRHAADLLQQAGDAKAPAQQMSLLGGAVRLIGAANLSSAKKTALYKRALGLAKGSDSKKLVLAALGDLRTIESLDLVAPYLGDKGVAAVAAAAAVKIACPPKKGQPGLRGAAVVAALEKVVTVAKDAKVRKRAADYLAALPKPDKLNLACGRPVKTSVPHQGNCTPDKAVDGNVTDRRSAWFGARWPSWLQVDLGKTVKIDTARVYFYWDGNRSYQYTLGVSEDGKSFKTVVDESKNTRLADAAGVIHAFAPVAARYVRLNVLRNSVNEAVHLVELKVYAEGTGPKPPPPPPPPTPDAEGFIPLFNGKDLAGWIGHTAAYEVVDGKLVGGGTIFAEKPYSNFIFRFEFKLTPGANSGVSLRAPLSGTAAYVGMEIQILDDTAEKYKRIAPYQHHGSIYGVVAAKQGHLKPVGEWNSEEIIADGRRITVKLNGVTIVDADIDKASTPRTIDGHPHPGLKRAEGYLGFCGHGSHVEFRNIKIKELK